MLDLQLATMNAASDLEGGVPQAAHAAALHAAASGIICSSEG